MHRVPTLLLLLAVSACSQRSWADGTWKLDAATQQSIRDANPGSLPAGIVASLLGDARLKISGAHAQIQLDPDGDPPPIEYTATESAPHRLSLAGPQTADSLATIELECIAATDGECSSLRVVAIAGLASAPDASRVLLERDTTD